MSLIEKGVQKQSLKDLYCLARPSQTVKDVVEVMCILLSGDDVSYFKIALFFYLFKNVIEGVIATYLYLVRTCSWNIHVLGYIYTLGTGTFRIATHYYDYTANPHQPSLFQF